MRSTTCIVVTILAFSTLSDPVPALGGLVTLPVNCLVGPFGAFSACSVTCDGGVQCRTRPILIPPAFGGTPCPSLEECQDCNTDPCVPPVPAVSEWGMAAVVLLLLVGLTIKFGALRFRKAA